MSTSIEPGSLVRLTSDVNHTIEAGDVDGSIHLREGSVYTVAKVVGDHVVVTYSARSSSWNGTLKAEGGIPVPLSDVELLQPVEMEDPDGPEVTVPEPETPVVTPPKEDPPMPDLEYRRYSKTLMRPTTKRPEVLLYQQALQALDYDLDPDNWYGNGSAGVTKEFQTACGFTGKDVDGVIGKGTATPLITQAEAAGFKPDMFIKIMAVITYYEVTHARDAYGVAENDIGDSAGANYGFMQTNNHGSVKSVLRYAGRDDLIPVYNSKPKDEVNPDIKYWFGTAEGMKAQNKYFREKIAGRALKELHAFGLFDSWENDPAMEAYWERAVLMWCDCWIQNGTMWSDYRKPFWKALEDSEKNDPHGYEWPELYYGTWWDELLGQYCKYTDEANENGLKERWWKQFFAAGGKSKDSIKGEACEKANIATAKEIIGLIPDDDPQSKLVVLAQMRARSSRPKYWFQAVASRRMTDATGDSYTHPEHKVNGERIKLAEDYGFLVP